MESEAQGLSRKKPVILPPRGAVNMLRVTAGVEGGEGGDFCFPHPGLSQPMAAGGAQKPAPCRETTPGCYKGRSRGVLAQNNARDCIGYYRTIPTSSLLTFTVHRDICASCLDYNYDSGRDPRTRRHNGKRR